MTAANPHLQMPVDTTGSAVEDARAAVIMLHGRGRDTSDMIGLAHRLDLDGVAFIAPVAHGNSWYPERFMEPLEKNQPWLDHALERVHALVADLTSRGISAGNLALLGFSQGACLAAEYAVRNPGRYGAIIALTGGLIGAPGTKWNAAGSFDDTLVYLGTSDIDEWVPLGRVEETAEVMRAMGADVELEIFPGMDHIVNDTEVEKARRLIAAAAA